MRLPDLTVRLPDWIEPFLRESGEVHPTPEARMRLAIGLARRNIERGTGGPFGAAIFERESGKLLAPGVNLVVPARCSILHAEIVAIMLAQRLAGAFDLGGAGLPPCELVASTEPCAMCLGAIPWSGVQRLVCGARDADAHAVGFDEGAKPPDWEAALRARGIEVLRDVLRPEARRVLENYVRAGGPVYNGRDGGNATS